jgi:hypothetical protein
MPKEHSAVIFYYASKVKMEKTTVIKKIILNLV